MSADADDGRPLKLVTEFNQANSEKQFGWQKMDDVTVLERKKIPVCVFSNSENALWGVMITIYDFSSFQTMTYVQQCFDSGARTPTAFRTHFSEIEGKQAIADAHRALTLLGGSPPPLDEVLGFSTIAKEMKVRQPLRLRPAGGEG